MKDSIIYVICQDASVGVARIFDLGEAQTTKKSSLFDLGHLIGGGGRNVVGYQFRITTHNLHSEDQNKNTTNKGLHGLKHGIAVLKFR